LTAVAWAALWIRGNTIFDADDFSDFTNLAVRVIHFGEPDMLSRTDFKWPYYPYPVPSIYAYFFFIRLFPRPLDAYLTFAILSFFIAACWLSWRLKRIAPGWLPQVAVWSTLLFGYPLVYLILRGNIEAVIWVLILLGVVAFTRNRMLISAILWALAASMKVTPGLLFVLFLAKRKYRMFVIAIAFTAAFSLLALAGVGPTLRQAISDSSKSAPFLRDTFILGRYSPYFDESLFGGVKQAISLYHYLHRTDGRPFPLIFPGMEIALRIYNILIPIGGILLYWFRLRKLPLLNQFIAYIVLFILLPQVSYEYKLVHMYLAWGAFLLFLLGDVARGRVEIPAWAIHVFLFACAVIFVPLNGLTSVTSAGHYLSFAAQVKAVFLLLILLTVLRVPMPSSLFGDLQTPSDSEPESNLGRAS
jgi:Glycosyltransferase family 87